MGRNIQAFSASEKMPTTIILVASGIAGEELNYNLIDGSIQYYEATLKNSFSFVLFDNIGTGLVRVSYNRPYIHLEDYVNGAKTMQSGDSFSIVDDVTFIKIYFIADSVVEMVLKSDKLT